MSRTPGIVSASVVVMLVTGAFGGGLVGLTLRTMLNSQLWLAIVAAFVAVIIALIARHIVLSSQEQFSFPSPLGVVTCWKTVPLLYLFWNWMPTAKNPWQHCSLRQRDDAITGTGPHIAGTADGEQEFRRCSLKRQMFHGALSSAMRIAACKLSLIV